ARGPALRRTRRETPATFAAPRESHGARRATWLRRGRWIQTQAGSEHWGAWLESRNGTTPPGQSPCLAARCTRRRDSLDRFVRTAIHAARFGARAIRVPRWLSAACPGCACRARATRPSRAPVARAACEAACRRRG